MPRSRAHTIGPSSPVMANLIHILFGSTKSEATPTPAPSDGPPATPSTAELTFPATGAQTNHFGVSRGVEKHALLHHSIIPSRRRDQDQESR